MPENMYSKNQKLMSNKGKDNWDNIKWKKPKTITNKNGKKIYTYCGCEVREN